ncbi:MAG TPA: hypothetical protein EYN06_02175 [Myxococcales bacterium]|nr:hypothetical protein [Myxococcales bacterium]HIN85258.1 hypothetical protein [Myxococcales bacterium]
MLTSIAMTLLLSASVTHHGQPSPDRVTDVQSPTAKVQSRMATQKRTITRGIRNGSLTRQEARVLRRYQRNNRRLFRRCLRDRYLSRFESRLLRRALKRTDRKIRRLMSNRRVRFARRMYHRNRIGSARALGSRFEREPSLVFENDQDDYRMYSQNMYDFAN